MKIGRTATWSFIPCYIAKFYENFELGVKYGA